MGMEENEKENKEENKEELGYFDEHGILYRLYDNLKCEVKVDFSDLYDYRDTGQMGDIILQLTIDTQRGILKWDRDFKEDLISITHEDYYVNGLLNRYHPLLVDGGGYTLAGFDPYEQIPEYCSLFHPNASMEICGDGYRAKLDETRTFYLMNVKTKEYLPSCENVKWEGYELYLIVDSASVYMKVGKTEKRWINNKYGVHKDGVSSEVIGVCCSSDRYSKLLFDLYQTVAKNTTNTISTIEVLGKDHPDYKDDDSRLAEYEAKKTVEQEIPEDDPCYEDGGFYEIPEDDPCYEDGSFYEGIGDDFYSE